MGRAILNIKAEKKLEEEVQKTVQEFGLSLNAIIRTYFRDLVYKKQDQFSTNYTQDMPNKNLVKLLQSLRNDLKKRKRYVKPLTYHEAIEHLNKL